jgi:hypothetical protein
MRWLIALIVFTVSSQGYAQGVHLEYKGQSGVWFPDEMAKKILADVETLPLLKKKIELSSGALSDSEATVERLRLMSEVERNYSDSLYKSVESALQAYSQAVEENERLRQLKTPLWKHPAIWFTVGAVVSIGLTVGAVQIVKAVD